MLTTMLLLLGVARAAPEVAPLVDVSAFRERLVLLEDGAGSLVAVRADAPGEGVWFGDRAHLWALQIVGSSSEGDAAGGFTSYDVTALDFRAPTRRSGVSFRDGRHAMSCGDTERALTPLTPEATREVLAKATFHAHRWRRNAVALFRDDFGTYYYIDRATGDDEEADHRVYVGWRGQVLRSPLALLASDSLGRVYAAGNGTRRLVITRGEARYVEGSTERVLQPLDLVRDGPMLYTTLGVYGDAPHGTPCDVLLKR
jgi:hypothetical protein